MSGGTGARRSGEPGFTVVVIREGGRGAPVELRITLRKLRLVGGAVGAGVAGLVLAAAVQLLTLPRVLGHDALVVENLELHKKNDDIEDRLVELEPVVQRVRAFDEQLRGMAARGALPGSGPMDPETMKARQAWIDGVSGAPATTKVSADALFADLEAVELDDLAMNLAALDQAREAMPQLWPVDGAVTSGFGWRRNPFSRSRWKFHSGLDIGAEYGSEILATGAGVVTWADWHAGHGRMVEVDHGGGVITRYGHASTLLVTVGEEVLAGQTIALVGSSGMSTGPHLHYELSLDGENVDPLPYLPPQ